MPLIGRRIDNERYEVVEELGTGSTAGRFGRGGFGIVYLGRDTRLHDAPVAIKYLRPEQAESEGALRMFKHEIQLSARLRHSNIVQVNNQIQEGDDHFVIFEYVDGADLKRLIAAARERPDARYGAKVPTELAVYIIREVCNALEYAHNLEDTARQFPLNIVHRDISPQNILISFDGEVKLTDFGIAKALDSDEHTQAGEVKGKYWYMSPEQIQAQPVDRTSDLYSLGIVLYEALVGEKLYSGDSGYELQRRVVKGGIDREKLESPQIPVGLRHILAKALQPDRNRRYQSGAEMAADLAEFNTGKYSLDRTLCQYMHVVFKQPAVSQCDATATMEAAPAQASPAKRAAPEQPGHASTAATVTEASAPADGERTVIDFIKMTASSGRRFFIIGGAVILGVLIALLAVDTFVTMITPLGRALHFWFLPPSAILTTVPDKAQVVIDGKRCRDLTPARLTGLTPKRQYNVLLTHDGYAPLSTEIELGEPKGRGAAPDTVARYFKMPVYITSTPPGATVLWNGQPRGVTPLPIEDCWVQSAPVSLKLCLSGFDTLPYQLNMIAATCTPSDSFLSVRQAMDSAGTHNRTLEIYGAFYTVAQIRVEPTDANVELDGAPLPLSDGKGVRYVKCGPHSGWARRQGFKDEQISFEVTRPETVWESYRLRRSVLVTVSDAETGDPIPATITIDGKQYSSNNPFGLESGRHIAEISAEAYQPKTIPVTVTASGEPIEVKLARGVRVIHIRVTHSGAPIARALVIAVAEDGSTKTIGDTDEAGEVTTTSEALSGRYRFDVNAPDGTGVKDQQWYNISWIGQSSIQIGY